MDPLSVTAAIVGLLGAGAKISSSLWSFIDSVKDAPSLARDLLNEVDDIRSCLIQLQSLILDTNLETRSRPALIMADHVVITLTSSVMNFSKLEKIVDSVVVINETMNARRRVRWARKEQKMRVILNRLQNSKTSLSLMLNILTW